MTKQEDNQRRYLTLAILVSTLIGGQLLFAGIIAYLNRVRQSEPHAVTLQDPLILACIMVASGSFFGAFYFRMLILGARTKGQMKREAEQPAKPGQPQTRIITMWALLESAGFLILIVYFLKAAPQMLYAALAYIALAALIFFPRRSWFERQG